MSKITKKPSTFDSVSLERYENYQYDFSIAHDFLRDMIQSPIKEDLIQLLKEQFERHLRELYNIKKKSQTDITNFL